VPQVNEASSLKFCAGHSRSALCDRAAGVQVGKKHFHHGACLSLSVTALVQEEYLKNLVCSVMLAVVLDY
jgi:hypothetical protein